MTMNGSTDTTAHRYYSDGEIACVLHSMDRGFAMLAGDDSTSQPHSDWHEIPQPHKLRWLSTVAEYRRGKTAKELYEALTGLPWSSLDRPEQVRMEMGQLLARGMASAER